MRKKLKIMVIKGKDNTLEHLLLKMDTTTANSEKFRKKFKHFQSIKNNMKN